MKQVPIDKCCIGMSLGKSVTTPSGMVSLEKGAVLTQTIIDRLISAGVDSLFIDQSCEIESKFLQERLDRLDHVFRCHKSNKFMEVLHNMVKDCLKKRQQAIVNDNTHNDG